MLKESMNKKKRYVAEDALIKKILVVDDDKGLRSVLMKSLMIMGYACHEAEDAEVALSMIFEDSYDLVISDISMPVMDGIEFMKKVKEKYPELDFIIMTGFSGEYSYVDIIDAGACDYMTKPFGINSVVARIDRIEREKRNLFELRRTNHDLNLAMERANALAKEANAAAKAKTDFLANMSHELRTPLNGILGYTDIFFDTQLTDEQMDYVQNVKISCEVLLSVVNDILDFSKVEAGQLNLENIEFDPEVLCFEALEVVRSKVNEDRVELICRVSDNVPGLVYGDPFRFRQVLLNLLGNAAKFTFNGVIELSLDAEEETPDNVMLKIEVRDTGIGIPQDNIKTIFEPFEQSDDTTTRKFGGTGLGLAICRKIAEKMQGRVWVESTPGKGSSFYFTSYLQKKIRENSYRFRPVSLKGKKAVLVAQSQSPLRDILSLELITAGMGVDVYDTGGDALKAIIKMDQIQENAFDICIVDAGMRTQEHLEFAAKIRELPGKCSTLPLLVCATSDPGGAEKCNKAGFDGFLPKPVQRKKFFKMIAAILGLGYGKVPGKKNGVGKNILTTHSLAEEMKRSIKILLVEDNIVNQKMAKIMLSKAGYHVDIASNGKDAVAKFINSGQELDLIFMDINMPKMDGLEATRNIRSIEQERALNVAANERTKIPIIALTANVLKEFEIKCSEAGMDDFLTKPLKREHVFATIQKWIE